MLLVLLTATAHAQTIPIPKIDSINFFVQAGDFEGKDAVDAQSYGPFGTYGWGFETNFNVASSASHVVELSVGYDQLYQHAHLGSFALSGEVRDLPSLSVYVSFPSDLYVGLATGVVSLANATIDDGMSRYAVSGDTFDVAGKIGYAVSLQPGKELPDRRVSAFVEAGYHARYFGGITYGFNAPADLPQRLYLGGFVVALGIQISIDPLHGKSDKPTKLIDKPADKPADKPTTK